LRLRPGLCPGPHWRAYSAPTDPLKGFASQQRRKAEWTGEKREGEGECGEKKMEREEKGRRGKGGDRLCLLLQVFLRAPR